MNQAEIAVQKAFWRYSDIIEQCGVSKRTAIEWASRPDFPEKRTISGVVLFPGAEVVAWVNSHMQAKVA